MGQGHEHFFFVLEHARDLAEKFLKTFFCFGERQNFAEILRFFLAKTFLENTFALCPWPREGQSSEGRALAPDFFCDFYLGLEDCALDSIYTSGVIAFSNTVLFE